METIILIIGVVWGILNIVLFFKLWGACDDIRDIADKYAPEGKIRRAAEKKAREEHNRKVFLGEE
ncbi:MAG: hypothetical protein HDS11_05875 [Bacteroides sp.]|nr:hypothetical protein [Bacteroides sp.]